jgi:hypothetical protein
MIQHIKCLITLLLLICFSCKEDKIYKNIVEKNATIIKPVKTKQETKTFTFYKAFSFCENQVGYFTEQEARDLYIDKTITLNIDSEKKANQLSIYTEEKFKCIYRNLDIGGKIEIKYFKTKDVFPFDNIALLDNKYIVVSRDGYFFVFINNSENKKNTVSKETISFQGFELLFNHKLIGLSIIDEKEVDLYKKYGLDFSTVCVCDSPSMYIDINSKELIIFNYCDSNKSMSTIKNKTIFKIVKTENEGNKISITASPNLKLTFEKKTKFPVFQMQVKGDFPTEYVGNDLKKNFTSTPEKFKKIDCGDFGG